ncbi:flavodoxin family protein [Dethiobacter alkaliphilus]|uniref:Flavodoxin-like domain-containing protein n=1 Tax=Dethiobacter alkaliphilus AHT 1 TaxID=555088 RepID=C0GKU0_DETAL|nr:flavodoxin domain-containing protein [Dethiobacter alkaliphilus]EEG76059.1 conserved hypothetical protein [Dethiobacter alkaliphilus AHT 1]
MNIGIIVYSQTGNTNSVAQKLKEQLEANGHTATIEKITTTADSSPRATEFEFTNTPKTEPYDAIIFAAAVQAFSLVPVMAAYLNQLPTLQNKKVACVVTKQLPFHWTGGNRAINKMKEICRSKGADIIGTEIIIWSKPNREENIDQCATNICSML